jgi:hypothetical protein
MKGMLLLIYTELLFAIVVCANNSFCFRLIPSSLECFACSIVDAPTSPIVTHLHFSTCALVDPNIHVSK